MICFIKICRLLKTNTEYSEKFNVPFCSKTGWGWDLGGGGGTRHEDNKSPHLTWIQIQNPEEEVMRITSDELKQGVDFEANFKQRKLL